MNQAPRTHLSLTIAVGFAILQLLGMVRCAAAFNARLSWSAVPEAASYKVYVHQEGQSFGTGIDTGALSPDVTGQIEYTVSGLPMNVANYFAVASSGTTGAESDLSNVLFLMLMATPTPTTAAGSSATPTALPAPPTATSTQPGLPTPTASSLTTPSTTPSAATATTPGLVAAYSFDEITGTTVYDSSGSANHGALGAPVLRTSAAKYGAGALSFSGTAGSYVSIPSSASLALSTASTFEAWVFPTQLDRQLRLILAKEMTNPSSDTAWAMYGLGWDGENTPSGLLLDAATTSVIACRGWGDYTPNAWNHVAFTYDQASGNEVVYLNGAVIRTCPQGSHSLKVTDQPLRIGGASFKDAYFMGTIDDVRIWNYARSAAQIVADRDTPVSAANPVASFTSATMATTTSTQAPSASSTRTATTTPTWSPTATVTRTMTLTTTPTRTATLTNTTTPTHTATPSGTASTTTTVTPTRTPSSSPTATATSTATFSTTATRTPTATSTLPPTKTATATSTITSTTTATAPPSQTVTTTATATASPTKTATFTATTTITKTITSTATPTRSATMTNTSTPRATVTETKAATVQATATSSPPPTATATVTSTFTHTFTAAATTTATRTVTATTTKTATPRNTGTATPTYTRTTTSTPTSTATATASASATRTATRIPTSSATSTTTVTQTASSTRTLTPTSTATFTTTPTATRTFSLTPTLSATPTATRTSTATSTATPTHTITLTTTPTSTQTSTFTPTPTTTRTSTVTFTSIPTFTATPSTTATASMAYTATATMTPTLTFTITSSPTFTASHTASATTTASPTDTVTPSVTATGTTQSSATPTHRPTEESTPTNTPADTATATAPPTATEALPPTPSPTETPTAVPTTTPTATHTPTTAPTTTATPTDSPEDTATATETAAAVEPTVTVTATFSPIWTPTAAASDTAAPTESPTSTPTPTVVTEADTTPTVTATLAASETPSPSDATDPTGTPTAEPVVSATPTDADTPIAIEGASPTATPTETPAASDDTPTATASETVTSLLTASPTATPTATDTPALAPTTSPTSTATDTPPLDPSATPPSDFGRPLAVAYQTRAGYDISVHYLAGIQAGFGVAAGVSDRRQVPTQGLLTDVGSGPPGAPVVAIGNLEGNRSDDLVVAQAGGDPGVPPDLVQVYRISPSVPPILVGELRAFGNSHTSSSRNLVVGDLDPTEPGDEIIIAEDGGRARASSDVRIFGGLGTGRLRLLTRFRARRAGVADGPPLALALGTALPEDDRAGQQLIVGDARGCVSVYGVQRGVVSRLRRITAFPDRPGTSAHQLAAGDLIPTNPGDEIVVGDDGTRGDGLVRVFDLRRNRLLLELEAFKPADAPGGVELWVGDVIASLSGAELLVGQGAAGGTVRVFNLAQGIATHVLDLEDPLHRATSLRQQLAIGDLMPEMPGDELAIAQLDPQSPVQIFHLDAGGTAMVDQLAGSSDVSTATIAVGH